MVDMEKFMKIINELEDKTDCNKAAQEVLNTYLGPGWEYGKGEKFPFMIKTCTADIIFNLDNDPAKLFASQIILQLSLAFIPRKAIKD